MPSQDNRQYFFNNLVSMGIPPQAALGVLYSLGGESGYQLDPTSVGKGGDFGVAQWVGSRKTGLSNMASTMGRSMQDPTVQWSWMKNELQGQYSNILKQLQVPGVSTEAANDIWTSQYEVPAVNNSAQRFRAGSQVGSLDDKGNLVVGKADASPLTATVASNPPGTTLNTAPSGTAAGATPGTAPGTPPPSPMQQAMAGLQGLDKTLHPQPQADVRPMQFPNLVIPQAHVGQVAQQASQMGLPMTTPIAPPQIGQRFGGLGGLGGMYGPYGMMGGMYGPYGMMGGMYG